MKKKLLIWKGNFKGIRNSGKNIFSNSFPFTVSWFFGLMKLALNFSIIRKLIFKSFFSFLCILLSAGCLTFDHRSLIKTGTFPRKLADYLNMQKNCWYVLESYYLIMFYNDFQDYTVIIKCSGKYDLFTRASLEDDFDKGFSANPPSGECHGKFRYFTYNGKQAFYFDLDIFFSENREFHEFIFNDGVTGFSYTPKNLSSDQNSNRASWTTCAPIDTYSIVSEKSDYSLFPFSAEDK